MMKRRVGLFAAMCLLPLAAGVAQAQSSPTTCEMVPPNFELHVSVDGRATTIESTADGILVNGAFCGWQDEISVLWIFGGDLDDRVTLRGPFIPGRDPEGDFDELEVAMLLGAGTDTVTLELDDGDDDVRVADNKSLHLNGDTDGDIGFGGAEVVNLMLMGGDDRVLPLGGDAVTLPTLYLYGGDGNDQLRAPSSGAVIDGGAGNDLVEGWIGNDVLIGGPGSDVLAGAAGVDTADYRARTAPVTVTIGNGVADDGEAGEQDDVDPTVEVVLGGSGADLLIGDGLANRLDGGGGADRLDGGFGADVLIGGPGVDTVDYSSRTAALTVTADGPGTTSGEVGEGDQVDPTVENVTGGSGNDTLIGNARANTLRGGPGNDTLQGEAGNDKLYGDAGDDALVGAAGADRLYGAGGSDVLDGGDDADTFSAGGGNDFLYNDDGVAETVNCGPGNADDAEVDTGAVDIFIGCEL